VTQPSSSAGAPPRDAAAEPSWRSWANALTLLRVALVPVIAVLVFVGGHEARWWAFGVFVFAAFTDSIDGWLARRSLGVTRWGQIADPAADKALIIGSLGVLAVNGELPWLAVGIIVVREIAVTVQRQVLLRRDVVMPASPFGKAKTVSQVVAVTLYLLPLGTPSVRAWALAVAVVLTVASGIDYAVRGASRASKTGQ
jgi:CDP-diacylglycerol--glycerol-3-phosphate 3-phosphatidyltransferase